MSLAEHQFDDSLDGLKLRRREKLRFERTGPGAHVVGLTARRNRMEEGVIGQGVAQVVTRGLVKARRQAGRGWGVKAGSGCRFARRHEVRGGTKSCLAGRAAETEQDRCFA